MGWMCHATKIVIVWQFSIPMELWYIMVDVWKTFCNKISELMVVYIPLYHCIMKLKQIWTIQLLNGRHFHFKMALSQCYNCKKRKWRTRFNGSLLVKFCTCKKTTIKKNLHKKIQFIFKLWSSNQIFKNIC
jgi:hypothetical protein